MPSKYEPLRDYLGATGKNIVAMTLSEVERVLGVPLPRAARTYQAWWANSGHAHARTWTAAGFRASVDIPAQTVTFTKGGTDKTFQHTASPPRRPEATSGTNSDRLIANQEEYFADSYAQFLEFGGPCVYFHEECLKAGDNAFLSTRHIESLYATLTAWGMHRLGTKAKLVDWDAFRKSIEGCGRAVEHLRQTKLLEVSKADYDDILKELAPAYRRLRVSISEATIVANSKALFHLLPNLIPPIDRQYTIRFIRYSPTQWKRRGKFTMIMLPGDAESQFDLFRSVCMAIKRLADHVQRSILDQEYREHGVTAPKAIDNAIVNYVRIESKGAIAPE